MEEQINKTFLNELIAIFLHNFIYYIPSEIILEGVIEQIEEEIEDDFFDQLSLFDNYIGIANINNEDTLEINTRLFEKRSLFEQNIFKLLEKNNVLSPFEFQFIIDKYFDQLILYLFVTKWLIDNLKKYNKGKIHLALIGAFNLQYENFNAHLRDFYTNFGNLLDLEKEHDFSTVNFIMIHVPEIISTYTKILNKISDESSNNKIEENLKPAIENKENNQQPKKKVTKKKKVRPQINDKEIEKMILERVFKVKMDS